MPRLESLRGLAALAVAIFHINQVSWIRDGVTHPIRACVQMDVACVVGKVWWRVHGHSAVLLFFVISGYVLTVSMQRRSPGWSDAPRYAASRALRLYPAVILMVALFATYQFATGQPMYDGAFSLADVVGQSLLLTNHINGVTYTLQLEIIGSALLFFAFHLDRRCRGWIAFGMFVVFSALSFRPSFGGSIERYGGPPLIFFSAFMAGMLSARLAPKYLTNASVTVQRALLIAATLLFVLTRPLIAALSGWTVLFESLSAAVIVGVLAQGRTGAVLDLAPLRFLGLVSFSFYLLHPMAWYFVIAHIDAIRAAVPGPDIYVSMAALVLSVAATLPIALFSYLAVERPLIRFGKTFARRKPQPQLGRTENC